MARVTKAASKPSQPRLSADEKRWRAESDMRILRDAQAIRSDRSRLTAARKEAAKTIKALQQASKIR
jgi:hypothetical protein